MKIADQPQAVVAIFQLAVHNVRTRLVANMGKTEDPLLMNNYREQLDKFNFDTLKDMELELMEPLIRTGLLEQFESIMQMTQQAASVVSQAQVLFVKRNESKAA